MATKNLAPAHSSLANPFNQNMHHAIDQSILFDEGERTRDQERGNTVDSGPKSLRHFFDIITVQLPRLDAASHGGAKVIETTLSGLRLMVVRNLLGLNERNNIVMRVIDAELHVRPQAAPQAVQGIRRVLIDGMHPLRQLGEGLFADAVEDFRLVSKI